MHDATTIDAVASPADTFCDLKHSAGTPGMAVMVDVPAELRLYLMTPTGIRYVDLRGHSDHDDMSGPDLVPGSHAVDNVQTQLEAEIDEVAMDWGISRERLSAILVDDSED